MQTSQIGADLILVDCLPTKPGSTRLVTSKRDKDKMNEMTVHEKKVNEPRGVEFVRRITKR